MQRDSHLTTHRIHTLRLTHTHKCRPSSLGQSHPRANLNTRFSTKATTVVVASPWALNTYHRATPPPHLSLTLTQPLFPPCPRHTNPSTPFCSPSLTSLAPHPSFSRACFLSLWRETPSGDGDAPHQRGHENGTTQPHGSYCLREVCVLDSKELVGREPSGTDRGCLRARGALPRSSVGRS